MTMASNGRSLIGLWFDEQKYFADTINQTMAREELLPIFKQTDLWLDIYFKGHNPDFTPPIEMRTTPFRRAVWQIMLKIPFGKTMSYGEIAAQIAQQKGISKMSAQAIGGAVKHNAISLIIPCHRVIGSNGNLIGYAGGLDKKLKLLELEKVVSPINPRI